MDDSDQLGGEVDSELRYGLQLVEDAQILSGDGTGQNLTGLRTYATAYAVPTGFTMPSNPNRIDQIGAAILQLTMAGYEPDGIVLSPVDWWQMILTKDQAAGYLWLDPTKMPVTTLYGLPVAVTLAASAGQFMVGAFKQQKYYERMAVEVLISSENDRDFELNLLTVRAEQRCALAVRKPGALIKGAFS